MTHVDLAGPDRPAMTFLAWAFAVRNRLSTSTRIGVAGEAVG